jgi:long-chain acyl-CoA synthetase
VTTSKATGPELHPWIRDEPRLVPLVGPGGPFELEAIELDGRAYRDFIRAPKDILFAFNMSAGHADKTYLVFNAERWTFAAVRDRAQRVATALRDTYGVRPGDRVGIAMRNLPEFIITFWGIALVGGVITPLNAWWTGSELAYALNDAGIRVVFADPDRRDRIMSTPDSDLTIITVRSAERAGNDVAIEDLYDGEPLEPSGFAQLGSDDPVTLLFTSGTTGRPKGAVSTNRAVIGSLWNMAFATAREAVISERPAAPPEQGASLSSAPLFHVGGIATIIGAAMGGSKIVMLHKWDVEKGVGLAQQERLTTFGGVPAIAREILSYPGVEDLDIPVRVFPIGGAAVTPDLPKRAVALFGPSVQVVNGYGLTETTSAVVTNVGREYEARPDSVGRVGLTSDVRIEDLEGLILGPREVGEVCVRSPQLVRGYWNNDAATKESFVDGWFHTGDLGYLDDQGWLYVVDRLKDVVIRGGENIYCAEVEAALVEHPAIADVAVIGIPDSALGERVCAVIVAHDGSELTLEEVRDFAAERIARFKCPEAIRVVTELPKTATGKVEKAQLRKLV